MRILTILILLSLLCVPASASSYVFEDTAGFDKYKIEQDVGSFNASMVIISQSTGMAQYDYIEGWMYDSYYTRSDDYITYAGFSFKTSGVNQSIPLSFTDLTGVTRSGSIDVSYVYEDNFFWIEVYDLTVSLVSNTESLLSATAAVYKDKTVRLTFKEDSTSLDIIGLNESTSNVAVFPVKNIFFDITDFPDNAHCYIYVTDSNDRNNELDGVAGFIYKLVSFADEDRSIYHTLSFFDFVWSAFVFVVLFVTSSFWYCIMLVEVISLAYAVMSRDLGGAIERYVSMHVTLYGAPIKLVIWMVKFIRDLLPF